MFLGNFRIFVVRTRRCLPFFYRRSDKGSFDDLARFPLETHDFISLLVFTVKAGSVRTNWDNEKLWWYQ